MGIEAEVSLKGLGPGGLLSGAPADRAALQGQGLALGPALEPKTFSRKMATLLVHGVEVITSHDLTVPYPLPQTRPNPISIVI